MILYMYIASGQGADNPLGMKILMLIERPYHFTLCCKFQRNLFEV